MAEQYGSFQGREPNIDVNLFVNALTQGIAAGNAQKTPLQAGIEGAIEGAQTGVKIAQGIQQIQQSRATTEAIEIQNQEATAEGVPEARRQQEIAKGREAEAGGDLTKQAAQAQAAQKLSQLTTLKQITDLVAQAAGGNTAIDLNSVLGNPAVAQLGTDKDYRAQVLGAYAQANQLGRLDPAIYKSGVDTIFAAADLEKKAEQKAYQENLRIAAGAKASDDTIRADASFADVKRSHPNTKWQNTELVSEESLNLDPNTGRPVEGKNGYFKPNPSGKKYDPERNALIETDPETGAIKVLKRGMPSIYKEQLFNLKNGQALADAYQQSTVGGVTKDELLKGNRVDTGPVNSTGLAGMQPVDTSPITPANMQRQAEQAVLSAEEGIRTIINESPTNSVKESIKRGIREGQGTANRTKNVVTSFQPTTVPLARNDARVTSVSFNPGEVMKGSVGSIQYAKEHLSNLVGGADVEINLPEQYAYRPANPSKGYNESYIIDPGTVKRIKEDPAYKGLPAKILGMIAIESGGRADAYNKTTGAAGAMQLLPGAAIDGGIDPSLSNRLNQEQNIKGGTAYLNRIGRDIAGTYTRKMKELQQNSIDLGAFASNTGQMAKLDPRAELLAYNGGASYVKAAIRAGKIEWDDMVQYIRDVKSTPAEEENIGYANKVVAASLLFIEGGNTSDEAYMNELLSNGILSIKPIKPIKPKNPGIYV